MSLRTEGDRYQLFSRRSALLLGGQALAMTVLGGRLYYLQVVSADKYKALAEDNRINMRLLAPLRGEIVDRFGQPIAANKLNYRVVLIPEQVDKPRETVDRLVNLLALDHERVGRVLSQIGKRPSFIPVTVTENLDWEAFAQVNSNITDLPGLQPDAAQSRHYPWGGDFAHIVGYVGPVSEREMQDQRNKNDPLTQLPEFRIGKLGVEKVLDDDLRGSAGARRVEVNALGREIRDLDRREGTPGKRYQLTLDAGLQHGIVERLGEESAGVAVMDIYTGDILALVSTPTFDPNWFNFGIDQKRWDSLRSNEKRPLLNKATQGMFPPGSTAKMVVAMAALETGVIGPDTKVWCGGKTPFGKHTFHCWKKEGHGRLDLEGAIQHSCDTYFYEIGKKLDIDRLADVSRRFGLGQKFGLPIDSESAGLVPTSQWKRDTFQDKWHQGETLNAAIGQGYSLSTPLQLAVMTSRIANGGLAVEPRLLMDPDEPPLDPTQWPSVGVPLATIKRMQEAMNKVSNHPRGTAYRARITEDGYSLAGKTGTAQVRRISKAERDAGLRKNEEKPWEERDHALFVCFGPVDNPRYAVAVIVEHGGGGAAVAAPVARDIMLMVQKRDPSRRDTAPEAEPGPDMLQVEA